MQKIIEVLQLRLELILHFLFLAQLYSEHVLLMLNFEHLFFEKLITALLITNLLLSGEQLLLEDLDDERLGIL